MARYVRFATVHLLTRLFTRKMPAALAVCTLALFPVSPALAQGGGSIAGRVSDETGDPVVGAQVFIAALGRDTRTRPDGGYLLVDVPAGQHTVQARVIGYRAQTMTVSVASGQRTTQDFTLTRDPLSLRATVVTGNVTPRTNIESSVAATSLSPDIIEQAAPRSTTEILRYVPGFTRVESSGGEVNQNISMRGILGVEYVMFMEDGLPVFPTMHTFFMNADNLFRPDENIDRIEVVRGGTSALFGSNTPGAIVNFITKTGGTELAGSMKASAGTKGLARYDFNVNGPFGEDWRFNVGGFYRYDHGVRDPGYPGVRGGQLKANVTRLLQNGYVRASIKAISDRNQFILPLPFQNPDDPEYVPGFSDYGSMNTNEGNHIRVPTPVGGQLELPLDNGLRTDASWLTLDAAFDLADGWKLQNTGQVMRNQQEWNAILPFDVMTENAFVQDYLQGYYGSYYGDILKAGGTLPSGARIDSIRAAPGFTYGLTYTNHVDAQGNPIAFNTPNGLISPGGEWHVAKPLTAFQDQLQLTKAFGPHSFTTGVYFANYTQDNNWYFTDILMDVRDNPRLLDLAVNSASLTYYYTNAGSPGQQVVGVGPFQGTENGFRRFISNYVNGSGQTTVFSGMAGGSIQLTPRLRTDLGARYEWNDFVQSSENSSTTDLGGDPTTQFDVTSWGNNTFRHFSRSIDDWAYSAGLNFLLRPSLALYAQGSRAYKMPALDEFLQANAQEQVDLFEPRRTKTAEGGFKYSQGFVGATLNGFYTQLQNIVSQGAVLDGSGNTVWTIQRANDQKSYGAEVEASARPYEGLDVMATATWLKATVGKCSGVGCAAGAGADVGSLINGVPRWIGNFAAGYRVLGGRVTGDFHYVGKRFTNVSTGLHLPSYNYFNFGGQFGLPQALTLEVALLNAFQSKGLEEGNPRLALSGGASSTLFLARPLLPRRLMLSLRHNF